MPTVIFFCEPLYEEIWSQNVRQFHPTKKCLWALLHVVSNDENSKALFQPSFLVVLECSIDKDERRAKRAITNRFAKLKKTIIKEKKTQLRDFRHDNKNEVSVKQDSAYRSQSSQEGRARALYPRGQATVSRTQIQPEATSEDRPAPPEKGAGRSSTLAAMASDASRSSGAPTEIEQMDQGEQPALQPATAPRRSTRSTHSAGSSLSRFAPEPQA
ncbi:hypothetical protein C8Q73DRAFT_676044 [Cubamyces lactineus]|nr:hypothetical protein C8Q73DRAFT_676044 [Cubamyces lactineus]